MKKEDSQKLQKPTKRNARKLLSKLDTRKTTKKKSWLKKIISPNIKKYVEAIIAQRANNTGQGQNHNP